MQIAAAAEPVDLYAWPAVRSRWSPADERGYEAFIRAIANADCHTVVTCLAGPANPLAKTDPPGLVFSADCADLVYMLRAYYAWKKGLPFGFVSAIEARDPSERTDLRFTHAGNRAAQRWDVTAGAPPADIRTVLNTIRNAVSTATFRIDPRIEGKVHGDFFSPKITRTALRPGTAIYNGDGHVVILTSVDAKGRIHFMDAHPDFSVTRGIVAGQFQPGDPAIAAGFHAWRPVAQQDGAIVSPGNAQIADFSMEQYLGPNSATDWTRADFTEGGRNADFLEFTRRRLTRGRLTYDLRDEAKQGYAGLCDVVQDRVRAVDDSLARGLQHRERPGRLEGVSDDERALWFAYSTPGRDKRLRRDVLRLAARLQRLIGLYETGDRRVHYRGKSLRASLRAIARKSAERCTATYLNSRGEAVHLTLAQILDRLPALSFDPYHCPERRWGAAGDELAACSVPELKQRWYDAEAPLRGPDAVTEAGPNPTLEELRAMPAPAAAGPSRATLDAIIDAAPAKRPRRDRR